MLKGKAICCCYCFSLHSYQRSQLLNNTFQIPRSIRGSQYNNTLYRIDDWWFGFCPKGIQIFTFFKENIPSQLPLLFLTLFVFASCLEGTFSKKEMSKANSFLGGGAGILNSVS